MDSARIGIYVATVAGGMVNGCHVLLCVRHDITGMRAWDSPLIILELIARSRPNTSSSRYCQSFRRSNCTFHRQCKSEKYSTTGHRIVANCCYLIQYEAVSDAARAKIRAKDRADGHFCAAGAEILYFGARSQRICEEKSSK